MKQEREAIVGKDPLAKIIDDKKLALCVECGKCVASCPMAEFYNRFSFLFSARGIIKKALLGLDLIKDSNIWFCLECELCARLCPAGVKYAEFVEDIRQLAISEGITENSVICPRCGRYHQPLPTVERLKEVLDGSGLDGEFTELCPQCRRDDVAEKFAFPPVSAKSGVIRHQTG
jgi:heterodisulfide reductase subunit C